MLRASSLCCLPLLPWLVCSACAGNDQTADDPVESAGNEQVQSEVEVLGSGSHGTSDSGYRDWENSQASDDTCCAAAPLVVTPSSDDVCAFHAEEDRMVLHHRDDERGVCVDFIMVRQRSGGILPEGLTLPWDWGVGHASSYPCTSEGEIVSGESPTTLSEITGRIGMGGGLTGLPASLMLHLQLWAPAVTPTEAGESYVFDGVVDVTATCDASATWATQPLNLRVEPRALSLQGCRNIGALDRLRLHQDDPSSATCTDLTLVADTELGAVPSGLSLPAGWRIEQMDAYGCWSGQSVPIGFSTFFTQAVGSVSFGGDVDGLPQYVSLDVSMSMPAEAPSIPTELLIPTQRLRSTDSIDVSGGCAGAF